MRLECPGRADHRATSQPETLLFWNTHAMSSEVFGRGASPGRLSCPCCALDLDQFVLQAECTRRR